jgi:hypothetical protein
MCTVNLQIGMVLNVGTHAASHYCVGVNICLQACMH